MHRVYVPNGRCGTCWRTFWHTNYIKVMRSIFLHPKSLDEINNRQGQRYARAAKATIVQDLERGHKRVSRITSLTPARMFDKKLLKIPNGRISLGQLFGDLAGDRAMHFLDIASPLRDVRRVQYTASVDFLLNFMFESINLLNPKIPKEHYGKWVTEELSGDVSRIISWRLGSSKVIQGTHDEADMTVRADAQDFIFTVMARPSLVRTSPRYDVDQTLVTLMQQLLSSNAFWM